MNPENGVSRIDPEKQMAMRPRKRRRRQMCWPGMGPAAVIILALAMVMVTAGRALQPSKAESSPGGHKEHGGRRFHSRTR